MFEKLDSNCDFSSKNASEMLEMPCTPHLVPLEASLSMYLEMGIFYLEESDT